MTTPTAPPASFPGTIKQFTVKEDGQVIYGAHANEWQNEMVAIETILGRNPHQLAVPNPSQPLVSTMPTVSDRIGLLENTVVYTSGNQTIGGNKEFTNLITGDSGLLLKNGTYEHRTASYRLLGDAFGYQGRSADGTAVADIPFQPNGGYIRRAGNMVWDAGNDGAGSGLDADMLDGLHASAFLIAAGVEVIATSAHPINNCTSPNIGSNGWQPMQLDVVTYADKDFGLVYPGDGWFHVTSTGIWEMSVNLTWLANFNGWRGIMFRCDDGRWLAHVANPVPDIAMYSSSAPQTLSRSKFLTAGTRIRPYVWQNSGTTLDILSINDPYVGPPINYFPSGCAFTRIL